MSPALALASACFGTFTLGLLTGLLIPPRLYRSHFADHGTTASDTERSGQYDESAPFGFRRP